MTLQELIENKGHHMVAEEIQYILQHHTGVKYPYIRILQTVFQVPSEPREDITLEDFVRYAIIAMHEDHRTGYLDMP